MDGGLLNQREFDDLSQPCGDEVQFAQEELQSYHWCTTIKEESREAEDNSSSQYELLTNGRSSSL